MAGPPLIRKRWSHNLHYHRVLLDAVPAGCERALDVGCGLGELTRELKARVAQVTGIDRDRRSIELARSHPGAGTIEYVVGDFLTEPLAPESFDLVTGVAALHHMDATAALTRMRDLLRAGGVLAVLGLARDSTPLDLALNVPAFVGHRVHAAFDNGGRGARAADDVYRPPISWPPTLSYRQMRRLSAAILPGARFRRHLYWRYSLTWSKPVHAGRAS
jgi:SAM-dependent methyltransferase